MSKIVKNNVLWVGKTDWEIRKFHGQEYSTHRGSTYNSYLIKEEKNVLIDTVWEPFAKEFVSKLRQDIDLDKIDYIVANHAEIDHSGALLELMKHIPDKPIYCTSFAAASSIKGHFHRDWNFKIIKTGDRLPLGNGKELIFVEAPMLHWPDSMFCYLTGDNILFSNDAFGQHYANEFLFNDLVDQGELFAEAIKYYANILTPFSGFVGPKIAEFKELNVPLDIICPSHGVIWRKDPMQVIEKYLAWSADYQESQVTIFYDTMWNGTKVMAESIAQGLKNVLPEGSAVKLFNVGRADKNDIITEIFKSKAVLAGSSTINRGILSGMAGILEEIKGLGFKKKKAAAFGSFGWSGEGVKIIEDVLRAGGFEVVQEGLKISWRPDKNQRKQCVDFGEKFGRSI